MAEKKDPQQGERPGASLAFRVTPRAKKNEITEVMEDGTLKIRITAPPVEGKANEALLQFLAEVLELPPARLKIVAGRSNRDKQIRVDGLARETIFQRIRSWGKVNSNR